MFWHPGTVVHWFLLRKTVFAKGDKMQEQEWSNACTYLSKSTLNHYKKCGPPIYNHLLSWTTQNQVHSPSLNWTAIKPNNTPHLLQGCIQTPSQLLQHPFPPM